MTEPGTAHLPLPRTAPVDLGNIDDEHLLRSVVDALDGGLCFVAGDGTVMGVNRGWVPVLRAMPERVRPCSTGDDIFGLLADMAGDGGDFVERVTAALREVLLGESGDRSFRGRIGTDADPTWLVVRLHPVRDHPTARAVLTLVDVNAAMRTQQELDRYAEESRRLALVAHHTEDGVVIADAWGVVEWVNDAFCRISGLTRDDVVGVSRFDRLGGEFAASVEFAGLVRALRRGTGFVVEFETSTMEGRTYWLSLEMRAIHDANGRVVRLIGVERDVTVRRRAEAQMLAATHLAQDLAAALHDEKSVLSGVISSIPHLVYWKDADLRYAGTNAAFLRIRGLAGEDHVVGSGESELAVDDSLTRILLEIEPGVVETGIPVIDRQITVLAPGRAAVSLLLSVLPRWATDEDGEPTSAVAGVIGVGADVTRVGELERQLSQANRLESMGQLAAGIAHEINTPIQYVSDNSRFLAGSFDEMLVALQAVASLVGRSVRTGAAVAPPVDAALFAEPMLFGRSTEPGESQLMRDLNQVMDGVDLDFLSEEITSALTQSEEGLARVSDIVRAMKEFSHPGLGIGETDLNQAITTTTKITRNEWKYCAELVLDLDPEVGMVPCYAGEFKQVVLNLLVNAAQAIEEKRSGTDGAPLGRIGISSRREADHVVVTVTDDGPGMDDATQRRIFDHFFTTKEVGKGTGQGLSMAYATIVQKHHGTIEVASAPGRGATFTITLPARPPTGPASTGPA